MSHLLCGDCQWICTRLIRGHKNNNHHQTNGNGRSRLTKGGLHKEDGGAGEMRSDFPILVPTPPTEDELKALCAEWQKRLRLQDWDLLVRYASTREMAELNGKGTIPLGAIRPDFEYRSALVMILRPEDCTDDKDRADIEITLVHELLHLYSMPVRNRKPDGDEFASAEEQMNIALSEALVALKYETKAIS